MDAWEVRAADGAAYLSLDLASAERWSRAVGGEPRLIRLAEDEAASLLLARQYTDIVRRTSAPWTRGTHEATEETDMSMSTPDTISETSGLPMDKPILAVRWSKPDGTAVGFSLHLTEEQAHTYVLWRKRGFPKDVAGPLQVAFTHEVLYADVRDACKRAGNPGLMQPNSLDFMARPPTQGAPPAGTGVAAEVSLANEKARVAALPPTASPVPAAVDPTAARPSLAATEEAPALVNPPTATAAERTLPLPLPPAVAATAAVMAADPALRPHLPNGEPVTIQPAEVPVPREAPKAPVVAADLGGPPRPAIPPPPPATTPKAPPKGAVIQAPGVAVRSRYVHEIEVVASKGADGRDRFVFDCPCCGDRMEVYGRKRERPRTKGEDNEKQQVIQEDDQ